MKRKFTATPTPRAGCRRGGPNLRGVIVDCAHYADGKRQHEGKLELSEAAGRCGEGEDHFVWLGLHEPSEEELAEVGRAFDLHELALEDAADAHQRPKIERYDHSLFVVLRTARYVDAEEEVEFGEISVFVGANYVIAVRRGAASELGDARVRLEERPDLLRQGPGSAVWAIADKVVDDYEPVVAGIENDIEEVEHQIFGSGEDATARIYFLKREVIEFHRATFPLLSPLQSLENGVFPQVSSELRTYFRDIADHARRTDEQVSSQRELLTSVLEANLALLGVQQNAVVRSISAWAAIIAVPTFLASIWGMNFTHMPELDQSWAYPAALILMVTAVLVLFTFFRRIRWL
ncbi:magnesium/cobalt transporter CorA [soil metagenome]